VNRAESSDTLYCSPVRQTTLWHCWNNFTLAMYVIFFISLRHASSCFYNSAAEYIIAISGRELLGRLMEQDIYRATSFEILPVNPNISSHNPPHPVETHLLALVRSHLHQGNFLFSYEWDLTRRLQLQWEMREKDRLKAFWETVSLEYSFQPMVLTVL
jgi:hypothetical protein